MLLNSLLVTFGTVDEPLASCMMVHFWGVWVLKWQSVCKFGIVERVYLSITCLCDFVHYPSFAGYFFFLYFSLWKGVFLHYALCTTTLHKYCLDAFIWDLIKEFPTVRGARLTTSITKPDQNTDNRMTNSLDVGHQTDRRRCISDWYSWVIAL